MAHIATNSPLQTISSTSAEHAPKSRFLDGGTYLRFGRRLRNCKVEPVAKARAAAGERAGGGFVGNIFTRPSLAAMRRARDGGEGDDLRGEPAALPAASSGVVAAAAAARGALATLLTEPPLLPATRTRFPDPRKAEEPDRTESPGSGAICTDFFGAIEWSPRAGRLYQPPTRAVRVTAWRRAEPRRPTLVLYM